MAKRTREMDYTTKIEQEGRGKGEGANYQPLYNNQDVTPKGRTTRTQDENTGRQALALSDKELRLRKVIEFAKNVIEIKDIYPISVEETQLIADRLGIKYPKDTKKKQLKPIVITLLVTREIKERGEQILAIKYVSANTLVNKNQIKELEIIRNWCSEHEYKLMIVTDQELNNTVTDNIDILHNYLRLESLGLEGIEIDEIIQVEKWLINNSFEGCESVRRLCASCAEVLDIKVEYVLSIYRHLVATQVIKIDFKSKWDASKVMKTGINVKKFEELVRRYGAYDNTQCNLQI